MVEMPGVKDPARVEKLLQGSANLEFWETYLLSEVGAAVNSLDARLAELNKARKNLADTAAVDSVRTDSAATAAKPAGKADLSAFTKGAQKTQAAAGNAQMEQLKAEHPLLALLNQQLSRPDNCVLGIAQARDTAAINAMMRSEVAKGILPADLVLAWSVKPLTEQGMPKGYFELYALKATGGKPALGGDVVSDARDEYDQFHRPCVSMTMNSQAHASGPALRATTSSARWPSCWTTTCIAPLLSRARLRAAFRRLPVTLRPRTPRTWPTC